MSDGFLVHTKLRKLRKLPSRRHRTDGQTISGSDGQTGTEIAFGLVGWVKDESRAYFNRANARAPPQQRTISLLYHIPNSFLLLFVVEM